jgi:hypothetical protein
MLSASAVSCAASTHASKRAFLLQISFSPHTSTHTLSPWERSTAGPVSYTWVARSRSESTIQFTASALNKLSSSSSSLSGSFAQRLALALAIARSVSHRLRSVCRSRSYLINVNIYLDEGNACAVICHHDELRLKGPARRAPLCCELHAHEPRACIFEAGIKVSPGIRATNPTPRRWLVHLRQTRTLVVGLAAALFRPNTVRKLPAIQSPRGWWQNDLLLHRLPIPVHARQDGGAAVACHAMGSERWTSTDAAHRA